MSKYIYKKIWRSFAVIAVTIFFLSFLILSLIHIFNIKSKSKIVIDGIRNELLLNDSRSLNQKLHTFVSEDDFITIQIKNDIQFSRDRQFIEFKFLDLNYSIAVLANNQDPDSGIATFKFTYSISSALKGAVIFNLLLLIFIFFLFPQVYRIVSNQIQEEEYKKRLEYQYDLSRQVAHDIRAPLMALEVALRDTSDFSDGKGALLKQASARIKLIAEDLLSKSKGIDDGSRVEKLTDSPIKDVNLKNFSICENILRIIQEKNSIIEEFEIQTSGVNEKLLVVGDEAEFQRILSNLLQNSLEALEGVENPSIHVAIRNYTSKVQLLVIDNGKGIPENILNQVGLQGFSYGKTKGNGLGVSFAKKKLSDWGGELHCVSKEGSGTMLTLGFQKVNLEIV